MLSSTSESDDVQQCVLPAWLQGGRRNEMLAGQLHTNHMSCTNVRTEVLESTIYTHIL